jgi:hypothetical protein
MGRKAVTNRLLLTSSACSSRPAPASRRRRRWRRKRPSRSRARRSRSSSTSRTPRGSAACSGAAASRCGRNAPNFGGLSDLSRHARQSRADLDLRRRRLAGGHAATTMPPAMLAGLERGADRPAARPRRPADREARPDADAEAIARLPDGSWLVAFERRHRLWRYPHARPRRRCPIEGPAEIGRQPANGGIEALAALADGTVIAISEEYSRQARNRRSGWIGKPAAERALCLECVRLRHRSPTTSRPRIAALPDGSFATLERAFDHGARGARAGHAVRRGPARAGRDGPKAEELAFLASPYASRQSRGPGIATPRRPRRDAAVADLGRQLQSRFSAIS